MPILIAFLKSWWKEILIAVIIAAVFGWYHHLTSTIADQKADIARLTTENTIVKENNAKLEASITANNAAITKLAEGAADTKKNFAALGTTVKTQSSTLEARLRGVLAEKKPQTCQDTIQYLLDAVKEYK